MNEPARTKLLIRIGVSAIVIFLIFGSAKAFLNSNDDATPFIFKLLSQNKYPASQLFLLMTLGPAILLMAFAEKLQGAFAKAMITFGKVPFFYYLVHIPLIHITALIVQLIKDGHMTIEWYDKAPYAWVPEEYRWSLWLLYLVFLIDVTILYFACRWYAKYKFDHPERRWLKFL